MILMANYDRSISRNNRFITFVLQKMYCFISCMACDPVLLKPNIVSITSINWNKQKLIDHCPVTNSIDSNCGFCIIFEQEWALASLRAFLCLTGTIVSVTVPLDLDLLTRRRIVLSAGYDYFDHKIHEVHETFFAQIHYFENKFQ